MINASPNQSTSSCVEVAGVFGDSVATVMHLGAGTERRRGAVALLCAGALSLVVAAGSFASAVATARADERALAAHLEAGGMAQEFRPERLSTTQGMLALGGFAIGLLSVGAGLFLFREPRRSRRFVVGRGPSAHFGADLDREHALVELEDGGRAVLRPWSGMDVELRAGASVTAAEDLVADDEVSTDAGGQRVLTLPPKTEAVLRDGPRHFLIRWSQPPARRAGVTGLRLDGRMANYVGASALAHLLVLAIIWSLPPDAANLADDDLLGSQRYVMVRSKASESPIERAEDRADDAAGDRSESGAAIALGAQGTMGDPSESAANKRMAVRDRGIEPTLARAQARAQAQQAGILGAMQARPNAFVSLSSASDVASGYDAADYLGGEHGDLGNVHGPWSSSWGGYVSRVGSPYYQDGIIRTTGYPGGRIGGDPDLTGGTVKLDGHQPRKPIVDLAPDVHVGGDLDRSIIRRHIRRKLRRIRHCYERRLLVQPELAGTLTARFTISPNGTVMGSEASGMDDVELQNCVAGVVATIEFPAVPGGGIVRVTYPFTFQSVGN